MTSTTTDLYIIAAGKGSRMGGILPKALVPITDGEPNLTTTLKQIGHKFNSVFVIVNADIQDEWMKYITTLDYRLKKNVHFVPIVSGLGDGHAVMEGLLNVERIISSDLVSDDVVICWGDVFFQYSEIIDELLAKNLSTMSGAGIMPALKENDPYVTLLVDEGLKCMSADFSKYGERHPSGFHDQSIFRFHREHLAVALCVMHDCFWKNGRYMTPGGEFSLLHTFHYFYNSGEAVRVYETEYPTLSFNTPGEVAAIQQEINAKWNVQSSSH